MKTRFAVIGLALAVSASFAQELQQAPDSSSPGSRALIVPPPAPATPAGDSDANVLRVDRRAIPGSGWNFKTPTTWGGIGSIINPDKDSEFRTGDGKLEIFVPGGKPHDYAPELKIYNSPRALSPSTGDFTIQVKVGGKFLPGGESTLPGRTGYNGAGLIMIAGEDNCVTLARAALQHQGGEPRGYINFEMRWQGELVRIGHTTDRPVDTDEPVFLRLERKGDQVLGSVSEDGEKWENLPAKTLPEGWPGAALAGVIAVSTSEHEFTPQFSEFRAQLGDPKVVIGDGAGIPQEKAQPDRLDLDAIRKSLPEEITPLTKEQLVEKVPHFYYFEYQGFPQPGKRYWLRVSDDTWIERYPDGLESTFKVLGHATVEGTEGTMVVKVTGAEEATATTNDGGLQAFIPDKGSEEMDHWYRNSSRGDTRWNNLAPMESVQ